MNNSIHCDWHNSAKAEAIFHVSCGDYSARVCETHVARAMSAFLFWTRTQSPMPVCHVDSLVRFDREYDANGRRVAAK